MQGARRPWMEEEFTKLQLFRWIAGADHATRCQRCSHLWTCTSSDISCKASGNCYISTAPSLYRSLRTNSATHSFHTADQRWSIVHSTAIWRLFFWTHYQHRDSVHIRICISSTATKATTGRPTRISTMISTTLSSMTRTVLSLAFVEIEDSDGSRSTRASSRSSNSHSSRRLAQIKFNKQHPYAKRNSSHPTPRPIPISTTTSHQILVVDHRATELASLARTTRAQVMGPSGAQHHPNAMRRTAARPSSHQQTRGKPTSYKSMDSRRSQRRHRSSPNSRTAREAR